jgi:hypothetical protein
MDYDKFLMLLRALEARDVEYVLVGGVAMGVHGLVRATEDIDFFVRPTAGNVQKLRSALHAVWDDPSIEQITLEDLTGDYPTIRYGPPGESFVIDLLARLGTAFSFEDIEAMPVDVGGVIARVATPRTLYRMKQGTIRPIDQADAAALRERFELEEP